MRISSTYLALSFLSLAVVACSASAQAPPTAWKSGNELRRDLQSIGFDFTLHPIAAVGDPGTDVSWKWQGLKTLDAAPSANGYSNGITNTDVTTATFHGQAQVLIDAAGEAPASASVFVSMRPAIGADYAMEVGASLGVPSSTVLSALEFIYAVTGHPGDLCAYWPQAPSYVIVASVPGEPKVGGYYATGTIGFRPGATTPAPGVDFSCRDMTAQ